MNIKIKSAKKNTLLVLLGVLLIVAILGIAYWLFSKNTQQQEEDTSISRGSSKDIQDKVDTSPPTAEERQDSDTAKEDTTQSSPEKDSSGLYMVSPTVVGAGVSGENYYAKGYVAGITEDSGTCTYTFTSGGKSQTKTSDSRSDATTTVCPQVTVAKSLLPSGQITVTLKYTSSTSYGTSPERVVQ